MLPLPPPPMVHQTILLSPTNTTTTITITRRATRSLSSNYHSPNTIVTASCRALRHMANPFRPRAGIPCNSKPQELVYPTTPLHSMRPLSTSLHSPTPSLARLFPTIRRGDRRPNRYASLHRRLPLARSHTYLRHRSRTSMGLIPEARFQRR